MSSVQREIVVDARPETIYPFLVDAEKHVQWMGTEAEVDATPGGTYRVVVAGQFPASGEFVELVPNEKVVMTFGWEDEDNPIRPGSTTVEWTLHPEGGKTRVVVNHTGLPDEQAGEMHGHGWGFYAGRLATVVTGGDAGPDAGPGGE